MLPCAELISEIFFVVICIFYCSSFIFKLYPVITECFWLLKYLFDFLINVDYDLD